MSGVFEHLLGIEKEADALLDDARSEAAKRVEQSEQAARNLYENGYAEQAAALEKQFKEDEASLESGYKEKLAAYCHSLDAKPVRQGDFAALVDSLL
jgi:F0F1-type ATP synthase membrane subunit b/b'